MPRIKVIRPANANSPVVLLAVTLLPTNRELSCVFAGVLLSFMINVVGFIRGSDADVLSQQFDLRVICCFKLVVVSAKCWIKLTNGCFSLRSTLYTALSEAFIGSSSEDPRHEFSSSAVAGVFIYIYV